MRGEEQELERYLELILEESPQDPAATLLSAIVIIASLFVQGGGFGGAWTAYPPLMAEQEYNLTPWGSTLWLWGVGLEFVAFLLGGINFIVTTMNSRAPGMKQQSHRLLPS